MTSMRTFVTPLCLLAVLVAPVGASEAPAAAQGDASMEAVPHLSGGVGVDEREQLEASAKDYNLKLVFAESSGVFVADVAVVVKSGDGSTVLQATAKGPLFFAKLPAGNYQVEVTYRGERKKSSTSLAATGQRALDFRW